MLNNRAIARTDWKIRPTDRDFPITTRAPVVTPRLQLSRVPVLSASGRGFGDECGPAGPAGQIRTYVLRYNLKRSRVLPRALEECHLKGDLTMRKFVLAALAVAFSVSVCEARWVRQRHCYVPNYSYPVQTEAAGSVTTGTTDSQGTTQSAQGQPSQQYQSFQHDSSSSVGAPRRVTPPNAKSQFQADRKIRGN